MEEKEESSAWMEGLLDVVCFANTKLSQVHYHKFDVKLLLGLVLILFGRHMVVWFTLGEACRLGNAGAVIDHLLELSQQRELQPRVARKSLRVSFAQAQTAALFVLQWAWCLQTTLAVSLGSDLAAFSILYLFPVLEAWFPRLVDNSNTEINLWFLSRLAGLVCAWVFYNATKVLTTSIRGAIIVSQALDPWLTSRQLEFAVAGLSAIGVLVQSSTLF
ncbi:hypothetical protein BASA81_006464 [Batrachochytrium salamandrivorans]|nr:hypothetical protein BASA81_006464 [Batrachochytrium salamandrivorans]